MPVSSSKRSSAGLERHDHLFQRGVARPLADAVDRDLDLSRAVAHAGQRVGRGHAQVVVAVHRDDGPVDVGHVLDDAPDQGAELVRRGVAGGVGDVDHRRAGGDDGLQHPVEVLRIGATGILGVVLHVLHRTSWRT